MRRPSTPATLETIAQALDGLSRHVEALDKDMQRLAVRIIPYEEEREMLGGISRPWQWPTSAEREKPNLDLIYKMLRESDGHIEAIERDFGAVRSMLDQIQNDIHLREDLKPYLVDEPRRTRR